MVIVFDVLVVALSIAGAAVSCRTAPVSGVRVIVDVIIALGRQISRYFLFTGSSLDDMQGRLFQWGVCSWNNVGVVLPLWCSRRALESV